MVNKIVTDGEKIKTVGERYVLKDSEIEYSESELNGLIPDSFEAENWKEVRQYYKLNKDGELVFDEGYEPETENEDVVE